VFFIGTNVLDALFDEDILEGAFCNASRKNPDLNSLEYFKNKIKFLPDNLEFLYQTLQTKKLKN
jgi:hypothetical protein